MCVCVFFPQKASTSNKNVLQGASKEGQQTPRTKSHSSQKHQTELQPLTQTQGRVMDPVRFLRSYAWSSWAMSSIVLQQSKAVKLRSPRGDITKTRLDFYSYQPHALDFVIRVKQSYSSCIKNWNEMKDQSQVLAPVFRRSSVSVGWYMRDVRQICEHTCLSPFNSKIKTPLSFTRRKWRHRLLLHPEAFVLAFWEIRMNSSSLRGIQI